jgi:hypothetical protein
MSDAPAFLEPEEEGLSADTLSKEELASLGSLRAGLQSELDAAERLAERLRADRPGSELVARLECVMADRLTPALTELASIEEGAFLKGAR